MRTMRVNEIGGLPVGVLYLNDEGQMVRDRSISFHRWTAKTSLEIGQADAASLNPMQFQHQTLVKLVKTWGNIDFASLTEAERGAVLDNAYIGDVTMAWILLRMEAMGRELQISMTCPTCRGVTEADGRPKPFLFSFDISSLECVVAGWERDCNGNWVENLEIPDFGVVDLVDGLEFIPRASSDQKPIVSKRVALSAPKWRTVRDLMTLRSVGGMEPMTIRGALRSVGGMEDVQLRSLSLPAFCDMLTIGDMMLLSAFLNEKAESEQFPGPALIIEEKCPNEACGSPVKYRIDPAYGGSFFSMRASGGSKAERKS